MNKKANKKGFTLIELLAVIVVLALIMVLAMPSILKQANNARKKTFQMYGQKIIEDAVAMVKANDLVGETTASKCYTFTELGRKSTGSYKGAIFINYDSTITASGEDSTIYTLYLTDGTYSYTGITSDKVYAGESISSAKADVAKITKDKCTLSSATE